MGLWSEQDLRHSLPSPSDEKKNLKDRVGQVWTQVWVGVGNAGTVQSPPKDHASECRYEFCL